ncbi:MAG: lamin tail domain-containing protein [Candidatus Eiseniibacteriota bacterium]
MERFWAFAVWLLLLAVAASVAIGIARSEAAEDLRLNEILAGPTRDWTGDGVFDARDDEWLEVENYGSAPVDLAPYRVSDADSTIRYAFSGTLAPGAVFVVTGAQALAWQRAAGRSATGLSLNNAGDTVILFRIGAADTTAVDVKTYNSIEGASDRSAGRIGSDGLAWTLFDGLNKYTGSGQPQGTGCAPTQGAANECPTPVSSTTWGKIKKIYQ